jgi:DNA-binding CsgD family transcriptional regulator
MRSHLTDSGLEEALLELHAALDVDGFWKGTTRVTAGAVGPVSVAVCLYDLDLARPVVIRRSEDQEPAGANAGQLPWRWPVTDVPLERRRDRVLPMLGDHFAASGRRGRRRGDGSGAEPGADVLVLPFWKRDRLLATVCLRRPARERRFSEADLNLLKELYVHFKLALRRLERLHGHRLARAAAEDLLRRIPMPVLMLDWDLNVIYSNAPGLESCAQWNSTGHGSCDQPQSFEAPAVLLKECADWKERWYKEMLEREKTSRWLETVYHPELPGLRADIHLVYREAGNTAKPVFRVQFEAGGQAHRKESDGRFPENLAQQARLTPRERELFRLVCEGASNKEIASQLFLSVGTVKKQLNTLFRKVGVSTRAKLMALAQQEAGEEEPDPLIGNVQLERARRVDGKSET